MLNEHPRLHVPRESYFLRRVLNALPLNQALSREQIRGAVRLIQTDPRWKDWEFSAEEVEGVARDLESASEEVWLQDVVAAVFSMSLRRAQKVRWGDKTPMYIHYITQIHQLFPEAKIVHLIRDGRDVAISLRRVSWHGTSVLSSAEYWARTVQKGILHGRPLGRDLYREFVYEDLVEDPEGTLRSVCRFIGEEYDPAMLQFHDHAKKEIAPWEKSLHTKVDRPPKPADADRWKHEMTGAEIAVFEGIAGSVMDAVGQPRHVSGYRKLMLQVLSPTLKSAAGLIRLKRRYRIPTPRGLRVLWNKLVTE